MATASIAALYPNSNGPSSAKTRQFSFDELKQFIYYSGAPLPTRALTFAALEARGPWPNQDGPATPVLCVSLKGIMLEGGVCKRTVQRRIKRACKLGFWRRTREANSWANCPKCGAPREEAQCPKCPYKGSAKNRGEFTRPHTYEFDVEKFATAMRCREIHSEDFRSYAEYKRSEKRGELREMPARKPAQPAPSDPPPAKAAPVQPAAEHHRSAPRPEVKPAQPKLTRREAAKFMANVEQLRRGRTSFFSRADSMTIALRPGENGYSPPLSWKAAFEAECAQWKRDPGVVRYALNFWGYQLQE